MATSLNGYWERMRRNLRMLGGDALPSGLVGVVIAADSREAGSSLGSYRRFSFSHFFAGTGIAATVKFKSSLDIVISRITIIHTITVTTPTVFYLADKATADADASAIYNPLQDTTWTDPPEAGRFPITLATLGARPLGIGFYREALPAAILSEYLGSIFLPTGAVVSADFSPLATNNILNFEGYAR